MRRFLILFLIFWGMHIIEGFPAIGGISIAQIWKMPLWGYLIFVTFNYYKEKYQKYSYWMAAESLINPEIINNTISSVAHAAKLLPLALFSSYFRNNVNPSNYSKYILWLSQFIAIATVPYLLGILKPIHAFDASFISDDLYYFSGCFGGAHVASSYYCLAILVILAYYIEGRFPSRREKILNGVLLVVLFISIYKSYVRTGWLMLIIGIATLGLSNTNIYKRIRNIISLFLLLVVTSGLLYSFSDTFRMRLSGSTRYSTSNEVIDLKGSGRAQFWINGVELWENSNTIGEYLFGVGVTKVKENNRKKTGMAVFSHSQFIDALAQHGILGIFLLLLFYGSLYNLIRQHQDSKMYRLNLSLWSSAVVFSLFQSEMYFIYALVFAISLCSLDCEEESGIYNNPR